MVDEVRAFEEASAAGCGCRCEGEGEGGEVEWRGVGLSRLGLRYFTPREVGGGGWGDAFGTSPPLFLLLSLFLSHQMSSWGRKSNVGGSS